MKWKFARETQADHKYLICNADEGDPGAFMDRAVLESDPHRVLEGMLIAAYAIGASKAYIYCRAEYPAGHRAPEGRHRPGRPRTACSARTSSAAASISTSSSSMGAGAFVCGEETALMHSIEGKRGMPRPRPPYPGGAGPVRQAHRHQQRRDLGQRAGHHGNGRAMRSPRSAPPSSKGTKVFALSGMVNRTGLVEVPMGITLREIVFDDRRRHPRRQEVQGRADRRSVGRLHPRAARWTSSSTTRPSRSSAPSWARAAWSSWTRTPAWWTWPSSSWSSSSNESCGKCIPCREGTKRMLEILQAITRPRRRENGSDALLRFQGVMQLKQLAETIRISSLCGLGQTAPNPVLSTLRLFRDEYEAHIFDRALPGRHLQGAGRRALPDRLPGGHRGVALRRARRPRRNRAGLPGHPRRQPVPVGVRPRVQPPLRGRLPLRRHGRRAHRGPRAQALRGGPRRSQVRTAVTVKPATDKSKKVAVIGAGPSGLTAAHYLSLKGHKVTVFEKENEPGGMLVNGIPGLPPAARCRCARKSTSLLNANIELKCNIALGKDVTVDGLLASGYDAVYVSIGAYKSQRLGIDGEDVAGVIPGMAFLKANNLRDEKLARGKVGIIGGGNTAMDAARVALRQPGVDEGHHPLPPHPRRNAGLRRGDPGRARRGHRDRGAGRAGRGARRRTAS